MTRHFLLSFFYIMFLISSCGTMQINTDQESPKNKVIVGYWEDQNGIISYFQKDGTFKTMSTDGSNTILATGFYQYKSYQNIEINLTSLIRNTSEIIECTLIKSNKLSCISSNKGQFYLERTHLTSQPIPPNKSQKDLISVPEDPTAPPISVIFYK
ncbi:MAG: hypothetical protein C4617_04210 [Candidatus Liberibacter europaeus]|uniref:Outer membrane lipoprotein n=1 Tax=Candidatus Liberibacter europaeus TaxID=744859 RepID=A0A2T4VXA7_9HYPH|nr:hypothetical protein [Candidatus Liberibacter europaeus]PTL86407.1 MAG: hypothetical protein C4617_04210 [Candidatus Liberibacter europaeus]